MVIGEFKCLRESWTDTGLKIELKHTYQRIDETENPSHTNSLVSKPHSRTVMQADLTLFLFIFK